MWQSRSVCHEIESFKIWCFSGCGRGFGKTDHSEFSGNIFIHVQWIWSIAQVLVEFTWIVLNIQEIMVCVCVNVVGVLYFPLKPEVIFDSWIHMGVCATVFCTGFRGGSRGGRGGGFREGISWFSPVVVKQLNLSFLKCKESFIWNVGTGQLMVYLVEGTDLSGKRDLRGGKGAIISQFASLIISCLLMWNVLFDSRLPWKNRRHVCTKLVCFQLHDLSRNLKHFHWCSWYFVWCRGKWRRQRCKWRWQ